MSYAVSAALQAAVFQQLYTDPVVSGLVGTHVYDAIPAGSVPQLYIALGSETVRDASDKTGGGALHDLTVLVVSDAAGFTKAKEVAGAVSDALVDSDLTLTRGALVWLNFLKARAARVGTGDTRRITLTFRARVDDDN
ncbi:DUF3168 domain-containing protein [Yoonia sp. 208BN28-4]|uniref:DUF3168 domain-containing protein n=1 Tax=Yoonia sp. 208BN28-4 TaxID=3126505 RepID=UPI0030B6DE22